MSLAPDLFSAESDVFSHDSNCQRQLERACGSLAGGDSSTMRVLPYHLPLVAERGEGSRVWDADGKEYIDLNMAYGPLLLGHRPRDVAHAVCKQISERGSQLGFPTEISARVAEKIKHLIPSMQLMRFANSGTEAIASAIRLARVYTGRNKIILFEGNYHGWSDAVFHRYHAPVSDLPDCGYGPAIPGTAGMSGAPNDVIAVRFNDIDALNGALSQYGDSVAAVIMEPVMGNAGVIPPLPFYLDDVRSATRDAGSLLIFDEVITGFRIDGGGAQSYFDVTPDITIVSKALGGGYPVAAFGASAEIMELVASGQVFHGGVYSGNAAVMAAAEAVLDRVTANRDAMYPHLHSIGNELADGLAEIMNHFDVPHVVQNVGPMVSLFLTDGTDGRLTNYREVRQCGDFDGFIRLQHAVQRLGVYFHPNMFEPMYLSAAHTRQDVAGALDRIEDAVRCTLAS